jgi:WD40 repeat protein
MDTATTQTDAVREISSAALGRKLLACRFDPSGRFVVAGGMNTLLTRCPIIDGKLGPAVHVDGHQSWVAALAFHPSGGLLFSGDYAGIVQCRPFVAADLQSPLPPPTWTRGAHQGWVRAIAVSPDGQLLATCGNDQMVRLWSSGDGQLVRELQGHESHVYNVAFHPAGQYLVSADLTGVVRHWELAKGEQVRTLDAKQMFVQQGQLRLGGARCIAFSPDGTMLALGGMTGFGSIGDGIGAPTVVLFDWMVGKSRHDLLPKESARTFVNGVAFHRSGVIIAATGGLDRGYVLFWKPNQRESVFQTKLPESAWSMDMNPTGTHFVTAHHDGTLRLFELAPRA